MPALLRRPAKTSGLISALLPHRLIAVLISVSLASVFRCSGTGRLNRGAKYSRKVNSVICADILSSLSLLLLPLFQHAMQIGAFEYGPKSCRCFIWYWLTIQNLFVLHGDYRPLSSIVTPKNPAAKATLLLHQCRIISSWYFPYDIRSATPLNFICY